MSHPENYTRIDFVDLYDLPFSTKIYFNYVDESKNILHPREGKIWVKTFIIPTVICFCYELNDQKEYIWIETKDIKDIYRKMTDEEIKNQQKTSITNKAINSNNIPDTPIIQTHTKTYTKKQEETETKSKRSLIMDDYIIKPSKYDTPRIRNNRMIKIITKAIQTCTSTNFFDDANQKLELVLVSPFDCICITNKGNILYLGTTLDLSGNFEIEYYSSVMNNIELSKEDIDNIASKCSEIPCLMFDELDGIIKYLKQKVEEKSDTELLKRKNESDEQGESETKKRKL